MSQPMLKPGTYCYVVPTCRASPTAREAVGSIVEVIGGPYLRHHAGSRTTCHDVLYRGRVYYCQADKMRAISDPDADIGEAQDGKLAL